MFTGIIEGIGKVKKISKATKNDCSKMDLLVSLPGDVRDIILKSINDFLQNPVWMVNDSINEPVSRTMLNSATRRSSC